MREKQISLDGASGQGGECHYYIVGNKVDLDKEYLKNVWYESAAKMVKKYLAGSAEQLDI